jgi:CBS domain-containing protein
MPIERVPPAAPDEPLIAILEWLAPEDGKRALVVDAGRVVSIVTASDITRLIDARRLAMPGSAVEH